MKQFSRGYYFAGGALATEPSLNRSHRSYSVAPLKRPQRSLSLSRDRGKKKRVTSTKGKGVVRLQCLDVVAKDIDLTWRLRRQNLEPPQCSENGNPFGSARLINGFQVAKPSDVDFVNKQTPGADKAFMKLEQTKNKTKKTNEQESHKQKQERMWS